MEVIQIGKYTVSLRTNKPSEKALNELNKKILELVEKNTIPKN